LSSKSIEDEGRLRSRPDRGAEILQLVREQVALGPRVPGSEAHDSLTRLLAEGLARRAARVHRQEFTVRFRGRALRCANLIGVFPAHGPSVAGPLLLGTHYDTRPRADREPDPTLREKPIPGANDGGSGTAVLLHLLGWIAGRSFLRDILVAFFDAEDLGDIDGKPFSVGAERLAADPLPGLAPEQAFVLDMVGGADMVFDVDAHSLAHGPSGRLTGEIFGLGASRGLRPFVADKPDKLKAIVSDHYPFLRRGIASCILIDIDYPQWHTQADAIEAMSADSLAITEEAVSLYLSRFQG
jgi:glutaminyl-peptide cyclotransferase